MSMPFQLETIFDQRRQQVGRDYDASLTALGAIKPAEHGEEPRELECPQHGAFMTRIAPAPGAASLRRLVNPGATVEMASYEACHKCVDTLKAQRDKDLDAINQAEQREREEARIRRVVDGAGVSPRHAGRTLDSLNAVNDKQQQAIDALKDVTEKVVSGKVAPNIILLGGVGTGKSLLAAAAIQSLIRAGGRGTFTTMKDIVRDYRATWSRDSEVSEAGFVRSMSATPVLVIDEVGVLAGTDNELAIIFDILDGRYRNMKPTILISNLDMAGVKAAIGDRCVDRMREDGGRVIGFDYESQRGKAA